MKLRQDKSLWILFNFIEHTFINNFHWAQIHKSTKQRILHILVDILILQVNFSYSFLLTILSVHCALHSLNQLEFIISHFLGKKNAYQVFSLCGKQSNKFPEMFLQKEVRLINSKYFNFRREKSKIMLRKWKRKSSSESEDEQKINKIWFS